MSDSATVGRRGKAQAATTNGARDGDGDALRRIAEALRAAAAGDFAQRLPGRGDGVVAEIAAAVNDLADRNARVIAELVRVSSIIGREGRMTERAQAGDLQGGWAMAVDSINGLIDDLVRPTTE